MGGGCNGGCGCDPWAGRKLDLFLGLGEVARDGEEAMRYSVRLLARSTVDNGIFGTHIHAGTADLIKAIIDGHNARRGQRLRRRPKSTAIRCLCHRVNGKHMDLNIRIEEEVCACRGFFETQQSCIMHGAVGVPVTILIVAQGSHADEGRIFITGNNSVS